MASRLKAVLWDVDGTLAETEMDGHRLAINRAFADENLPWQWDQQTYQSLLTVSGGRERLVSFLKQQQFGSPEKELVDRLIEGKKLHYRNLLAQGAVCLRSGVYRLIKELKAAGLIQGIVTTSGRDSVSAMLEGLQLSLTASFHLIVSGDDVERKKPNPEAYRQAMRRLELTPENVLVIEDSANGLAAAEAARLPCLVYLS